MDALAVLRAVSIRPAACRRALLLWLFSACMHAVPQVTWSVLLHVAVQVGGGDQLYCDPVFELPTVKQWLTVDDPHVSAKLGLLTMQCDV